MQAHTTFSLNSETLGLVLWKKTTSDTVLYCIQNFKQKYVNAMKGYILNQKKKIDLALKTNSKSNRI